jgi:hypothetical protein
MKRTLLDRPRACEQPMANLTVWQQITAEFSGHPLSGSYAIEDGMVKVKTPYGEKATHIGSFNPEWVARRLLEELAEEGTA